MKSKTTLWEEQVSQALENAEQVNTWNRFGPTTQLPISFLVLGAVMLGVVVAIISEPSYQNLLEVCK